MSTALFLAPRPVPPCLASPRDLSPRVVPPSFGLGGQRACAAQRATTADLMYVKEDLILPQGVTFHHLISTKARGKSGPLFHFDVHDDIRLRGDATKEKDESHAGKVCERHWCVVHARPRGFGWAG